MIRFALRCAEGHRFDSWFASGADYDRLSGARLLACPVCGAGAIAKDLMAPRLRRGKAASDGPGGKAAGKRPAAPAGPGPLTAPASPAEQAVVDLRRRIEAVADDVGRDFPDEARRIHEGRAPARPIIGEARPAEARALLEDGVPIAPLPWVPPRKAN